MPYTGGASGAAIPATVAAMIAGANFTTQAIVLTNASLGLLDKTYSGGVAGLFDVSTLFEVTALVSIIAPAAGAKLLPQRIVDLCKNPAWVKRLLWAKRGGFATSIAYNYWMYSRSDQLGSDDGVSSQDLKHDARVGVIGTLIDEFKKGHYPSAAGTVAARR
jgi:hypothetical protein